MTCYWHLVRQPPFRSHLPVQTGEGEGTGMGCFDPEIHPGRFHGRCQDGGRRHGHDTTVLISIPVLAPAVIATVSPPGPTSLLVLDRFPAIHLDCNKEYKDG